MAKTNLSIHRILCPTDFSKFAASAFAESVRMARWFGAKVTVVHVIPLTGTIVGNMGYVPMSEAVRKAAKESALQELQRFANATPHAGVPVDTLCLEGSASHGIRRVARETAADLIVMGTHGRSGLNRLVLGSVTEAVLQRPPAPVLTVNRDLPAGPGLFRTVLSAVDVSECSAETVAVASALAHEDATRFLLLNVIEHGVESAEGGIEHVALAALDRLIPDEAGSSYSIERRVSFGEADAEILALAAKESADLVVMGARGEGVVGNLFGSTVRHVVRDAACAVLVVPAGYVWPARGLVPPSGVLTSV